MGELLDDLDLAPARVVAPPPKRWRNKWDLACKVNFGGEVFGPGETWGVDIYPCADTARTAASELLEANQHLVAEDVIFWLGAHPV